MFGDAINPLKAVHWPCMGFDAVILQSNASKKPLLAKTEKFQNVWHMYHCIKNILYMYYTTSLKYFKI